MNHTELHAWLLATLAEARAACAEVLRSVACPCGEVDCPSCDLLAHAKGMGRRLDLFHAGLGNIADGDVLSIAENLGEQLVGIRPFTLEPDACTVV
jgi:hypothetical protein